MKIESGANLAVGELVLSTTPFETLGPPFPIERARFFTVDHKSLKFFQPRPLFDLPAIEVGTCDSAADIESRLRRAWSVAQGELTAARERFRARRIDARSAHRGTRLQIPLNDFSCKSVEVRSPVEIQLPSVGPLADVSLASPKDRRFRPYEDARASELEIALTTEMGRLARDAAKKQRTEQLARASERPALSLDVAAKKADDHRVLVVAQQGLLRDQLVAELPSREIRPDIPRDPTRALDAFRRHSYELVLIQAQMPRIDGFELTVRMRNIAGIEQLPIVLLEERSRSASQVAAQAAGASAYLPGPFEWDGVIATFDNMLDNSSERRFSRFPARFRVRTHERDLDWDDLTESVARGGLTLRTRREIELGRDEHYRIALPKPLGEIDVVGRVVSRVNLPGFASVLAGVRLLHFHGDGEVRWIRVIEYLAARALKRS
ncbi:MAG: response regulator [bacterium]|nr:response regulator [bacterium]